MAGDARANIAAAGLILAVAGAFFYWAGLRTYRLKKTIEYTPTTKIIAAAPGIVEIAGAVRQASQHVSPYGGEKCAYYCTKLYRYEKHGKSSSWVLKKKLESPEPVLIDDGTGIAQVRPQEDGRGIFQGGMWKARMVEKDSGERGRASPGLVGALLGQKPDTGSRLYKFVEKHAANLLNDSNQLKVEETLMREGDAVFAIGQAKFGEGQGGAAVLEIVPDERRKIFCLADGSEKNAMSHLGKATLLGVFGSPFAIAGGIFMFAAAYASANAGATAIFRIPIIGAMPFHGAAVAAGIAAVGAALFLAINSYTLAMHAMEFYNGTVSLRMSVERARANVDVLLKRRAELLPNLVQVVRAASKYESGLQQEVANMRAAGMEADEKTLVALAEKYPDLQANQNYMELQKQLVKTEEWLAASRAYAADSIMLYNTRIMQFPYSLVAMVMKMRPISQEEALR